MCENGLWQVLTAAYEGKGLDYDYLCQPNPLVVPLTADGYSEIKAQNQSERLASFIGRVVVHLGATVVNQTALEHFAAREEERPEASFGELVTYISHRPSWTSHPLTWGLSSARSHHGHDMLGAVFRISTGIRGQKAPAQLSGST